MTVVSSSATFLKKSSILTEFTTSIGNSCYLMKDFATWSHLLLNWCIWADFDCVYWESFYWCLQMFVYLSKLGTELMSAHRRSLLFWGSRLLYAQSLDPNLRMIFLSHKWQEEEALMNWLWITPHLQLCIISFTHYLCSTTWILFSLFELS